MRWTPVFAGMTNPSLNRLKRNPTASPRPCFQLGSAFFRHPGASLRHPGASLRHPGASLRHPGERQNLRDAIDSGFRRNDGSTPRRVVIFTVIPASPAVIPAPSTVIPAKAGIYACRLHYRLPQPSYRLPQLSPRLPQPSFRRKPESRPCSHIHRHSGPPNPASAAQRLLTFRRKPTSSRRKPLSSRRKFSSFRRKPESTRCDGLRFSPERRIHI